jgi:ABC-2 type transport system permease protein
MNTFNAYIKKEILEALRQYKYLIIAVGIIFFAISGPIMVKLTPMLIKSQPGISINSDKFMNIRYCLQSFISSLYQISIMFIVFTVCTSIGEEITLQKLVFPYSKGASPLFIVMSKFVNYSIYVLLITTAGIFVNNYYSSILFKKSQVSIGTLFTVALLISLYYIFNIALVMFFSSLMKKSLPAGILTLIIGYASAAIIQLPHIKDFLPYKLISDSSALTFKGTTCTAFCTAVLTVIFLIATVYRMNHVEII